MSHDGLIRSFLSHASEDKDFVEVVAQRLGRQYCLFDKYEFSSGVEFKDSIDGALAQSGVFVLFASRDSLKKYWVDYEMTEAQTRSIRGAIERIIVYVIDASVSVDDIPAEFKKAKIEFGLTPAQVARDIAMHAEDILRKRGGKYYFGRGNDHDEFARLLLKRVAGRPPHVFIVVGLPGVGRREFLRRSARDSLSLRKTVEVRVAEGAGLSDFLIQLTDLIGFAGSLEALKKEAERIRALSLDQQEAEAAGLLKILMDASELLVIVDEGGVLSSDGRFEEWLQRVVSVIHKRSDLYCSIASTRRPFEADGEDVAYLRLQSISEDATKLLVAACADEFDLILDNGQIEEIAKYVAGYPPAAGFAVQQAKEYGVELLLASKERLVDFRRRFFFDYIEKLKISEDPALVNVLRLLAYFSPLPLSAIGDCLRLKPEDLAGALTRLVDISLVDVGGGLYRVADPVTEAANKHFGLPTQDEARALASILKDHLNDEVDVRRLDVSRALFKAARLSGDEAVSKSVVRLTSDIVGLVEKLYHQRRYEEAVAVGILAQDEAPDASVALGYLIRSLVQLERWGHAEELLKKYRVLASNRDYLFLKAFLSKRKGNIQDAIALYEQSREAGRSGVSISRELAQCYALIGDYKKAKEHLADALRKDGENRFVVDLWAIIAGHLGDKVDADLALAKLEVIDDRMFFLFRKSRISWLFGDPEQALIAARQAVEQDGRPSFHVLAQQALCELVVGSKEEARRIIDKLDKDFSSTRKSVRVGLRVRLMLSDGEAVAAEELLEKMPDKIGRSYKQIKHDILVELLKMPAPVEVQSARQKELERLSAQIGEIFDFPELDER